MNKFLSLLLIFSFLFPQAVVEEEECFTGSEIQEIELHISTLEQSDSLNVIEIDKLKEMVKLYEEKDKNNKIWLDLQFRKTKLLDEQIKLYDDLVKQVKPKWYENKWLWFTIGVVTTAGTLKLASDIVD